jgi:hypothetical protein
MGYTAITAGKAEVLKLIKQWTRKKSTFAKREHMPILAILSEDNSEYYHISVRVNRYNIQEKLSAYQWIKESFNAGRFATKTITAKLDANYKPYDIQEVQQLYNNHIKESLLSGKPVELSMKDFLPNNSKKAKKSKENPSNELKMTIFQGNSQ